MAKKSPPTPTSRELTILGILWENGPSTIRQVNERMNENQKTGYTTTLKLMQIMLEKGLLVRNEMGRPHVYKPAQDEEKMQKHLLADLLDTAFAGSTGKLVMRALSARNVSEKELKQIRKRLEKMEGGEK